MEIMPSPGQLFNCSEGKFGLTERDKQEMLKIKREGQNMLINAPGYLPFFTFTDCV